MEGNLAFTAPTVDQFRNPHTLMKDFLDEDDLYKRAGDLVAFLIAWKPSTGATLSIMMIELAQVRTSFLYFHNRTEPEVLRSSKILVEFLITWTSDILWSNATTLCVDYLLSESN